MTASSKIIVERRERLWGDALQKRDARILELLRAGKKREEVADECDCNLGRVKMLAQEHGLTSRKATSKKRKNATDGRLVKDQLAYCVRELGADVVAELGADDVEGVELQRLYAAVRVVLLDANGLIPRVQQVLDAQRRVALVEAADSRGAE